MNSSCNDPYQIVINWDEGAMYNFCPMQAASERDDVDADAIKGMLEEIVDEHAKAKVDVLVHGVFSGFMSMMAYPRLRPPSGGGVHAPATAEEHEAWCQNHTFWLRGFKKLADAGMDLVQIIFDRCQHHGMQFYAGFRMNDRHAGSGQLREFYPRVQQMAREHPEWMLEEFPGGVNYKYEGVRTAVLDFIEEAIERYDLDGIELDWMRWCHMFNRSEAVENAPLLTELMGVVRRKLDDAAARRGRQRLGLGARVASTIDECTHLGYDVAAWIGEGLVDYLCPSDFYHTDVNIHVEDFVKLTEGTDCRIYPSIHPSVCWDNAAWLPGIEEYRAAATNFYAYGAHGVSPYNYMYHWGKVRAPSYPGPAEMWPKALDYLTELKDADRIAGGDRRYIFHPLWSGAREGHCPTGAYKHDTITLDRSADDPHGSFVFRLAEHLDVAEVSATLSFKVTEMIATDVLEVRINDTVIPTDEIDMQWRIGQSPAEGRSLGPHFLLRLPLGSPPVRFGDNTLALRLLNRVGMTQRHLNAQEFEVLVQVR